MHSFWNDFYIICEILLIVFGIGFFVAIFFIAMSVLNLKNSVMACAKRLYQPPMKSTQMLAATGKGVALKETAHLKVIGKHASVMVSSLKETASEVGEAAKTLKPQEVKTAMKTVKSSLKLASALLSVAQQLSRRSRTTAIE